MISEDQIRAVAERLREAAPNATIILFGSHARGDAREWSDLDILVIEPVVTSRHAETTRLSDQLSDLDVLVGLLVTSEATYRKWADEACTVYHEAARDGRVLYAPPCGVAPLRPGRGVGSARLQPAWGGAPTPGPWCW